ncbi:hypothetical protein AUC70_11400 [Methyloceanibacter stevinii]|uniref:Uncharacterized protein n=1 Tax=Methyloceanibacter stevinii TaxID=1774970 RepID=A0A1E3VIY7_9HYPH|nr:hypothetical protein [Methyloceanibacter stevinii]ODR93475.1 hypothetical protein AUC70_11400 [Methyloceanibacter stevinii]
MTPSKFSPSAFWIASISGGFERSISTAIKRGTGSAESASVDPIHGSSSLAESSALIGLTRLMPDCFARNRETKVIFFSMSVVSSGLSSMVISLAMSSTHALADW